MAERGPVSTSRTFPVTIAVLSCIYHLIVALSCAYLPEDPLHIGVSVQLYAWAGTLCSLLGLGGIVTKNSALITAFSHWLLIDAFVATAVRLLLLQLFLESFYDQNICSSSYDPTWNPRNFRHDIVTSVQFQKEFMWQASHKKKCRAALSAVHIVLLGLLMCLTVAQGTLAVAMRRFGKELEARARRVSMRNQTIRVKSKPRRSPEPSVESEKTRLEIA